MKPKGFVIPDGYMGLMPNGRYQRFDTEGEYLDYIKEADADAQKLEVQARKSNKDNGKQR